mgnify:CR=1 FL=1
MNQACEVGYLLLTFCQCWNCYICCHVCLMLPINPCIIWTSLVDMFCCPFSIFPCLLMPYICHVTYVFIAINMPICCSNFLLTSWCLVVSLLLSDPCLLWRCSSYMFWSMLWVIYSHAMVVNFWYHMPLFHACKHAIIMLLFYTCWNYFNIQSCLVSSH